jgi:hypothetical protein
MSGAKRIGLAISVSLAPVIAMPLLIAEIARSFKLSSCRGGQIERSESHNLFHSGNETHLSGVVK